MPSASPTLTLTSLTSCPSLLPLLRISQSAGRHITSRELRRRAGLSTLPSRQLRHTCSHYRKSNVTNPYTVNYGLVEKRDLFCQGQEDSAHANYLLTCRIIYEVIVPFSTGEQEIRYEPRMPWQALEFGLDKSVDGLLHPDTGQPSLVVALTADVWK